MVFVATVISRTLPREACLELQAPNVSVSVKGTFATLAPGRTHLRSEEVFRFNRLFNQAFGFLATRRSERRIAVIWKLQALRGTPEPVSTRHS